MTLVETMIAALVLAMGLGGIAILFSTAATSTQRTKLDTNSTLVAKMVMEQIAAQDPSSTNTITLVDCSGTSWTINTAGSANPGSGATVNTTSGSTFYGGIDFTQSTVTGYYMKYKDCGGMNGQSGGSATYDVRWNIMNLSTDTSGVVRTRLITVAAKQQNLSSNRLGNSYFQLPVNLRAVSGPLQ